MQFKKIRIRKAAGKKKSQGGQNALNKLNSFLNAASAEPAYILHHMDQPANAITYKGNPRGYNERSHERKHQQWQQDYSKMVSDKLSPVWVKAMETASLGVQEQHDSFSLITWTGVTKWVQEHGAEFVTNISAEQKNAVSALIARAYSKGESAEELSRAIRPCIGLTQRQAIANANYYDHVKDSLLKNNPGMKEATAGQESPGSSGQVCSATAPVPC